MAVVYVDEYGATVRSSKGLVIIEKDGSTLASVRVQELTSLVIQENALLTSAAIAVFLRKGVDVAFISRYGEYLGKLESVMGKNVTLRRAQYALAENKDFCLAMARRFVAAKLANMRTIVMRYARSRASSGLEAIPAALRQAAIGAGAADDLDGILGFEGIGSREYFRALAEIIKPPFSFSGRNRRPPLDPVNAMLGFGYALLENEVERAVSLCGLDPYCGFFHQISYGRQSLVLDLMEELRPVIGDSVTITVCNQRQLDPVADFEKRDGGVFLNESGRQKFFRAFEKRMQEKVKTGDSGEHLTYRELCVAQARKAAESIRTGRPTYKPFLVK